MHAARAHRRYCNLRCEIRPRTKFVGQSCLKRCDQSVTSLRNAATEHDDARVVEQHGRGPSGGERPAVRLQCLVVGEHLRGGSAVVLLEPVPAAQPFEATLPAGIRLAYDGLRLDLTKSGVKVVR